jgi:hypothetical protein
MKDKKIDFINIFLLIILCTIFIFSFSCDKNQNKKTETPQIFTLEGKEMEVIGLIEKYYNENWGLDTYSIVENPESKSRKTYIFLDLSKDEKELLQKYLGKIIKVRLLILEEISPWTFKTKFIKIIE